MISNFNREPLDTGSRLITRLIDEMRRLILDQAVRPLDVVLDRGQPAWKRALLVGVVLELVTRCSVRLPVGIVARWLLLHAAISTPEILFEVALTANEPE